MDEQRKTFPQQPCIDQPQTSNDADDPMAKAMLLEARAKKARRKCEPDRTPSRPPVTSRSRATRIDPFVCDVFDAVPKGDLGSMEHPMLSLSKRPDFRIRYYAHRGISITVTPSDLGLATIYDKDILIYCISQVVAKMNERLRTSRTIRLTAYDLLKSTGRPTAGVGYRRLENAFVRLAGTHIKTNIISGGLLVREGFGLIEEWNIVEQSPRGARMLAIEVTLSKWLYAAIRAGEVLTLHRDYFHLRKPMERRLYELARKHCGRQPRWRISMDVLRIKSGSRTSKKEFARMVQAVVDADLLPGYRVASSADNTVTFYNRAIKGRQAQVNDLLADCLPCG